MRNIHKIFKELEPYSNIASLIFGGGSMIGGGFLGYCSPIINVLGKPLSVMVGAIIVLLLYASIKKIFFTNTNLKQDLEQFESLKTYIILQFSSIDKQNPTSEPLILIDEDIKNILTHKVFRDSANELLISIEFKKVPKDNNRSTNIISLNNNPQVAIQCLHSGKYMYFGKIYGNLDNKNGRYKIEWSWQQND